MNKIIARIMIAAALVSAWGCSSDSDENGEGTNSSGGKTKLDGYWVEMVEEAPTWAAKFTMPEKNLSKLPELKQVDFYMFETTMTAVIHLQPELAEHFSEDDFMVAVVDGEVREIAYLQTYQSDEGITDYEFMLLIPFDSNDEWVDIYYHNKEVNRTYVIHQAFRVQDDTVGSESEFVYELFDGVSLELSLPSNLPFAPANNDQLAVFVDDVCCGVGTYDPLTKTWEVTAFNLPEGDEKAHVRYYSARQKAIYSTANIIDFHEEDSEDDVIEKVLTFL